MARTKPPSPSRASQTKWDADLFLSAAFTDPPRLAITKMLESLAEQTGSFGAVLWRCERLAKPFDHPPTGHMNLLAGWFKTKTPLSIPRIPLNAPTLEDGKQMRVVASEAVIGKKAARSNDLKAECVLNADQSFLTQHHITRTLAVPVRFTRSKRWGAISLYRRDTEPKFGKTEAQVLKAAAQRLPKLYHARWNEAAYKLLEKTETVAHDDGKNGKAPSSAKSRSRSLQEWAEAVQDAFQCMEVSVYLRDEEQQERFALQFTTEGYHHASIRGDIKSGLDDGFSGLVLHTHEPLRIHDTQDCAATVLELQVKWPGFTGHRSGAVSQTVNETIAAKHSLPLENVHPPHALLAVPILAGDRVLGLARCWFLNTGRQFFSSDDEDLLTMAAANLAHLILSWEREDTAKIEQKAWRDLAEKATTRGNYNQRRGGQSDVFSQGLQLVEKVVTGADINTVRLIDEAQQQLYFYAYPKPNKWVREDELAAVLDETFDLTESNASFLAARVIREKQALLFEDVERYKTQGYTTRFSGVRHMIIAPIMDGKKVIGVLDVRSCREAPFPPSALALVDTVAKMVGAQRTRQNLEADLWRARQRQAETDHIQAQAYEDIAHQTKGPLTNAERTLKGLIEEGRALMPSALSALHGMVTRALNMAKIVGTIAKLGHGQSLEIDGKEHTPADWVQLVTGVCSSNLPRLIAEKRNVHLKLNADSFWKHAPALLKVDGELVTQAISCLVDNAIKYSYPNTNIQLFAGKSGKDNFWIAIRNEGIPIRSQDVARFRQRGVRGDEAKRSTGEGNGIGLWIVDHIMRAHQGTLEVMATRKTDGITEIKLIF